MNRARQAILERPRTMEQKEICLREFPVADPLSAYNREENTHDIEDEDYAVAQNKYDADDDRVHVTIAWAIPVDAKLIGAQLEAYGESKATVHVFRKCIQLAHPSRAMANIAPELVGMIATHTQTLFFEERLAWWEDADRCARVECGCFNEKSGERCTSRVEELMAKLGERHVSDFETNSFAKYRKVPSPHRRCEGPYTNADTIDLCGRLSARSSFRRTT